MCVSASGDEYLKEYEFVSELRWPRHARQRRADSVWSRASCTLNADRPDRSSLVPGYQHAHTRAAEPLRRALSALILAVAGPLSDHDKRTAVLVEVPADIAPAHTKTCV